MFKRILWATDGSKAADHALTFARELAGADGASLEIVHVVQKIATSGEHALGWYADEEKVAGKTQQIAADLTAAGIRTTLKIVTHVGPQPAHQIADLAREADADLIVVGTRGHGALAGLVVGSVTQRLLHVAPCPVLVVPPEKPIGA